MGADKSLVPPASWMHKRDGFKSCLYFMQSVNLCAMANRCLPRRACQFVVRPPFTLIEMMRIASEGMIGIRWP